MKQQTSKLIMTTLFLLFALQLMGQNGSIHTSYQEAEFPGGKEAMYQFIAQNMEYPAVAMLTGEEGKVIASFTVNEKGKIKDIKIEQSVSHLCDQEVVRIIKKMPKWNPAIRNGKAITVTQNLPITFRLPDEYRTVKTREDGIIEPQFPGGDFEMAKFISNNLKYPPVAQRANQQGRVYVSFTVKEDGSIENIKVKKSAGGVLDSEAIRIVKLMPKWTPATKDGEAIAVEHMMPVVFRLMTH